MRKMLGYIHIYIYIYIYIYVKLEFFCLINTLILSFFFENILLKYWVLNNILSLSYKQV